MSKLTEFRENYPEYNHLSDQEIADKFHDKFYSHIPKEIYYKKIGLEQPKQSLQNPLVSTFLGKMPQMPKNYISSPEFQEQTKDLLNIASGNPGMKTIGTFGEIYSGGGYPEIVKSMKKGYGFASDIASHIKPISKKSIVKSILNRHDELENKAIEGFETTLKGVKDRKITPISLDKLGVDLKDVNDYFPKTKTARSLIEEAKSGDYESLRKMQSDLYHEAKKNAKSDLSSERMKGEEMFELRDDINNAISNHLKNTGNQDLAEILNRSRQDYKTLQDIYYNPNINNAIKKMVDKSTRKIPKNITTILQEESLPMEQLRQFHPGLKSEVKKYGLQKAISSKILKYALPAGIVYEYFK